MISTILGIIIIANPADLNMNYVAWFLIISGLIRTGIWLSKLKK